MLSRTSRWKLIYRKVNKTKIEWCDWSWNPITGCENGCEYCYARRIYTRFKKSFKPTFHPERLEAPYKIKKPSRIFADSVSDFWSRGVKQAWRNRVWTVMKNTPQHTYLVLTKQPYMIRAEDLVKIPDNCFVGVSITNFEDRWRIKALMTKALKHTFVSVEPMLDNQYSDYIYLCDWIILGGLTGTPNPQRPHESLIDDIVSDCRRLNKPLFIKDNLGYSQKIQEFPKLNTVK